MPFWNFITLRRTRLIWNLPMHLLIILYAKTVPSFPMIQRNTIWTMSMPAKPYLTYINWPVKRNIARPWIRYTASFRGSHAHLPAISGTSWSIRIRYGWMAFMWHSRSICSMNWPSTMEKTVRTATSSFLPFTIRCGIWEMDFIITLMTIPAKASGATK